MSDYTPTEKDVRLTFAYIQGGLDHDDGYEPFYQVHEEEFDRFIRKVRAEAWNEGYEAGSDDELAHERGVTMSELSQCTRNPYEVTG